MPRTATRRSEVIALKAQTQIAGHVVGWVVSTDDQGVAVSYPNNPHGPLRARSLVPMAQLCAPSTNERVDILLVFEEENSDRPVVVGRLQPQGAVESEAKAPSTGARVEATVDGRRVTIQAEDEIVLQCGAASITLRRNGRVVIRGAYVETRAQGVNRIKGGSVQIN